MFWRVLVVLVIVTIVFDENDSIFYIFYIVKKYINIVIFNLEEVLKFVCGSGKVVVCELR